MSIILRVVTMAPGRPTAKTTISANFRTWFTTTSPPTRLSSPRRTLHTRPGYPTSSSTTIRRSCWPTGGSNIDFSMSLLRCSQHQDNHNDHNNGDSNWIRECRSWNFYAAATTPTAPIVSTLISFLSPWFTSSNVTHCDSKSVVASVETFPNAHVLLTRRTTDALTPPPGSTVNESPKPKWFTRAFMRARRVWRMICRCVTLGVTLTPILVCYPLLLMIHQRDTTQDAQNILLASEPDDDEISRDNVNQWILQWYLRLCLTCVEASGAAVIKLMQWAGSRPDLFGHDFCHVFSKLQDRTTPHSWKHTERVMRETLGPDWQSRMRLHDILGSGCIGQVYRGEIISPLGLDTAESQPVAVKVLHPNVEADIDADLDLLRLTVRILNNLPFGIWSSLRWLNMECVVEDFSILLKSQLDLRVEGRNLDRFNRNFHRYPDVIFPQLVPQFPPTKHVLVETFIDGIPVLQYARSNHADREKLKKLCLTGIKAVCKMIFLDNFVHGDLHPGNVFISRDGQKFIVLDVGIVTEYSDSDHGRIVGILSGFVRKDGRKAGALMIDDSNSRLLAAHAQESAIDEEQFIEKMEALTIKASGKDYFMEHLGTYISHICSVAAQHHVMMNPAFITAALAVKVQEGIALALDPGAEIWRVATPVILESESKRGMNQLSMKSLQEHINSVLGTTFGVDKEE